MKFGQVLLAGQVSEWRDHYLPYNTLKGLLNQVVAERVILLKEESSSSSFISVTTDLSPGHDKLVLTRKAETLPAFKEFKSVLDARIQSIGLFFRRKQTSLLKDVYLFLAAAASTHPTPIQVNPPLIEEPEDSASLFLLSPHPPSPTRGLSLKGPAFHDHLYETFVALHQLVRFAEINSQGIRKILKKFDKLTQSSLGPEYVKVLEEAPFSNTFSLSEAIQSLFTLAPKLSSMIEDDVRLCPRSLPFDQLRAKENFIIDMDGVLYHGNRILPGVHEFIDWLRATRKRFLFLTNSSDKTPAMLRAKLERLGITNVEEGHFYTSALSTASFLANQLANGRAYVIGDIGLHEALTQAGITVMTGEDDQALPDFVVVGETADPTRYHYASLQRAVNFVRQGARLIGTNLDVVDNAETGYAPACGALVAPIEVATGKKAYYLGKPNPLMMTSALTKLGGLRASTIILGDRMDTDILGGLESGIDTLLLLSGVTGLVDIDSFAYRPRFVLSGVAELVQVLLADLPSSKDLLNF